MTKRLVDTSPLHQQVQQDAQEPTQQATHEQNCPQSYMRTPIHIERIKPREHAFAELFAGLIEWANFLSCHQLGHVLRPLTECKLPSRRLHHLATSSHP